MLRNVAEACLRVHTCSCVVQPLKALTRTASSHQRPFLSLQVIPSRQLHSSPVVLKVEPGVRRHTKIQSKTETASNVFDLEEPSEENEGTLLNGLKEGPVIIPTLETHDTKVHGIPYRELPTAHIHCSRNNTIILMADHTGQVITKKSCGTEGFKHAKQKSNLAAQATGVSAGKRALKEGVTAIKVAMKGLGSGRLAAVSGLKMAGMEIISLTDTTPYFTRAPKPRKVKKR